MYSQRSPNNIDTSMAVLTNVDTQDPQTASGNADTSSTSVAYETNPGQIRLPGLNGSNDQSDSDDSLVSEVMERG